MLDAEKSRIKEQGKKALTDGNALGENEEENLETPIAQNLRFAQSMRSSTCRISAPRAGAERLTTSINYLCRGREQPSHRICHRLWLYHTLALTSGRNVPFGLGRFYQLGHQEFEQFAEPTLVEMTVQRPPDTGEGVQGVPGALDVGSKAFIRKIAAAMSHRCHLLDKCMHGDAITAGSWVLASRLR